MLPPRTLRSGATGLRAALVAEARARHPAIEFVLGDMFAQRASGPVSSFGSSATTTAGHAWATRRGTGRYQNERAGDVDAAPREAEGELT